MDKKFIVLCYLEQGSRPLSFEWFKDGRLVSDPKRYRVETTDDVSALTIDSVVASDSANYSCKATNEYGWHWQHTKLLVKGLLAVRLIRLAHDVWRTFSRILGPLGLTCSLSSLIALANSIYFIAS